MTQSLTHIGSFDQDLQNWAIALFEELKTLSHDGVGISRMTYGGSETDAMKLVAKRAEAEGLATAYDAAANLVITLPGQQEHRPFVACGSHLDSVPVGGNYDGAAGVVAGLMGLLHLKHRGIIPSRSLKVYAFRGEESAWFGRAYLGSRALLGQFNASDFDLPHRDDGVPLEAYMRQAGADINRLRQGKALLSSQEVVCFLELHIEQGPVLMARDAPVGIVTGIRGNHRYRHAVCHGEATHAGAAPRWLRKDAVFAISEFIMRLDRHWQALLEQGQDLVVTVGVLGTNPSAHAMSRVPEEVHFNLEYRSQSLDMLKEFEQLVRDEAAMITRMRGVTFDLGTTDLTPPAVMHTQLLETLATICQDTGISHERLPSGAGHDAAVFANVGVPTAMVFVRNQHGSHNPSEAMDYADFFRGAEVLLHGLLRAPEVLT
jgi:N-carbamoyl-L-amino-acid hydrolase